MNKLMIVAHPDDESLFGGATLLEGGWKVVCITNGDNSVRREEFEKVMSVTNSDFEIWSYYDKYEIPLDESTLKNDIHNLIKIQSWDKIVTHNQEGEYGHPHHIQLNKIVCEITPAWVFDFRKNFLLPDAVWEQKIKLIQIYKSQKEICDGHIPNVRNERIVRKTTFF